MTFNETLAKYSSLLKEQVPNTQDAAAPAPTTEQPPAAPQAGAEQPTAIPPEGYVDMVRLLAKALVMNIPTGSIDAIFTTPITKENATQVREGLQDAILTNENYEDNPQRLENPHFKAFVNSINEKNFMSKYKELLKKMQKFSNDPKLK